MEVWAVIQAISFTSISNLGPNHIIARPSLIPVNKHDLAKQELEGQCEIGFLQKFMSPNMGHIDVCYSKEQRRMESFVLALMFKN
jgi:hypothetical protein